MRSACVLWLGKLSAECLRNSLEISQQSSGKIATPPFFNKPAHHLSFERKWEDPCVSRPCTAMRKQSVFKVLNEETPGFVVGKRWTQCQQAEPEPSRPTLQGLGHGYHYPGTCGSPRAANGHPPSFLVQHHKDTRKLTLVLYPWICTLHLCMQLSWSMVTSIFWFSWCAYGIHFPCVCPIWSSCGHQPGRGQPWGVGGTMKEQQVTAEPMLGQLCPAQDCVFVICAVTVPCGAPDVHMPCFLRCFLSHLSPDVNLQFSHKMFKNSYLLCKATASCLQSLPLQGLLLTLCFQQLKFKWETNWLGTRVGEDQDATAQ